MCYFNAVGKPGVYEGVKRKTKGLSVSLNTTLQTHRWAHQAVFLSLFLDLGSVVAWLRCMWLNYGCSLASLVCVLTQRRSHLWPGLVLSKLGHHHQSCQAGLDWCRCRWLTDTLSQIHCHTSQHWSIPRRRQHTGQFVHVCNLGRIAWPTHFLLCWSGTEFRIKKKGRNEHEHKGMIWLCYQEYRQRTHDVTVSHCSSAVVLTHGSCSRLRGVMTT